MGGDPFSSGQGTYPGAQGGPSQGGFRGYEYYQSQVDPEELFRKIFGDAFSRGGFGNHEWTNGADQDAFNNQRITQVTFLPCNYFFGKFLFFSLVSTGFNISRSCTWR